MPQLIQAYRDERLPFDAPTLAALGQELNTWQRQQNRMLLGVALPRAELLVQNLTRQPMVERLSIAGSIRRGVDMVGDINIVMASSHPPQLIHVCNQQPEVRQVIESGPTSTVLVTSEGLRVSLVAVLPSQFAGALLHYTGSAAHLAALRRIAQRRGLRLTEYGLTRLEGGATLAVGEEHEIYQHLGLPYMAPELREDCGEIDVAEAGRPLPELVTPEDIRGDLHVHSDWGNGSHSLEDIAQAAQRMGYQYVTICDYTYTAETGRGLSPDMLVKQVAAIRRLNAQLPATFRLLAGAEVEITPDGDLTMDEAILQELDLVIAAAHTGLKASRSKLTKRLCRAMEHPLVHILAHPTGRMLGRQDIPSVDFDAVLDTALDTQTCLEINSHMLRLDLPDQYVRRARDLGVVFALGSDAHAIQEMRTMRLGIATARRGWVESRQLLNTLPYQKLLQRFKGRDISHVF